MAKKALRVYTLLAATLQSVLVITVVLGVVFLFLLAFGVAANSLDLSASSSTNALIVDTNAETKRFLS